MEANLREWVPPQGRFDDADAAAEALHWADAVAAEGDYSLAVKWLDRAERLLGGLTPRYEQRRRDWRRAADRLPERA
jgi:hypothetical protein